MNRFTFLLFAIKFSFAGILPAQTLVFDNGVGGPAGMDDALQSDTDPLPEFNNLVEIAADDFLVNVDTFITNIKWSGVYVISDTPKLDTFVIRIYGDNNGPIGQPLATLNVGNDVNRLDSGFDFMSFFDIYEYSADIEFDAVANTTYWVSIDAQSFSDTNDTWFWGSLSTSGNAHVSTDIGNSWSEFGQTTTMILEGVVTLGDIPGDVNCDGIVDLLDVAPFIDLLTTGKFISKADLNKDGSVDLLDVGPFVDLLAGN
ncbi:MAG: dockerin type I domain-containing protein [Planctomycetota bacterium]